jgi:hypothetical protein
LSQVYNFDGKALLLESANLYYNFSYFLIKQEPSSEQRWVLSNTVTATRQFNRVFSGSARAGREDFSDPTNSGFAYVASTSLDAVPLKTLRHNLAYSGRFEEGTAGNINTNSVFLNNYATIYQGVDLTIGGGMTIKDQAPDARQESTDLIGGAGIQPHRTLNLSFNMDLTRAQSSGGGKQATTTSTRITGGTATYHPVETLYLVAGISTITTLGTTRRTTNYAFNWSPFFSGALQFAFAYSEGLDSEKNARVTNYSPSLTWRIARTTFLTAAYQATQSTSEDGRLDSKIFSTNLRANF